MKDNALLITALSALLLPIAGLLFVKFIDWLEYLAFTRLPDGKLRSMLITGWTGTTPKTLGEMRAQRDR